MAASTTNPKLEKVDVDPEDDLDDLDGMNLIF